jgi:UTP--glucose-1-phosphate uridylyltransferase
MILPCQFPSGHPFNSRYTEGEMQIRKAVITAAAKAQRSLPMQTLIDEHGSERSVLSLVIQEALRAGIEEICVVVFPGDDDAYAKLAEDSGRRLRFIEQHEGRGYGHAVWCARDFVQDDAFLHLVGDHIYVGESGAGCAQQLVEVATAESCAVSAVQVTRENLLPYFGTVGGQRALGRQGLYRVDTVIEKPTPTEAEQSLVVPGLRSGQYLCFYGMHVLTPGVMDILASRVAMPENRRITLSDALAELAKREQYLALVQSGRRFDVGVKYGLFYAQLALALAGQDRDQVLANLLEVVATREIAAAPGVRS